MAPLLRLFPFKYRDPLSGVWTKGRYKATLEDIRARYAEWMIDGEPELRGNIPSLGFNPHAQWTDGAIVRPVESNIELQPQRAQPPALDCLEVCLVATFLRRYVTYCARRHRFAAMNGAAALLAECGDDVADHHPVESINSFRVR